MILPHFSCSALINAAARSGVPPSGKSRRRGYFVTRGEFDAAASMARALTST